METITIEVLYISTSEIKKAIKGMSRGKTGSADGLSIDLIKDVGDILQDKLALIITTCLQSYNVPSIWKKALIILLHKKGNIKDLKSYHPISFLSVVYKFFTKVFTNRISATLYSNQSRE